VANVIEYNLRVDTTQGTLSLKKVGDQFHQVGESGETGSRRAAGGLESLFTKTVSLNQALELAQKAFSLLSTPIEKIISVGANFETLRMQLDTVMQSASKGKEYFEWIQEFAAKTPFQMEGLTKTVILLENFGINAKTSLETIGNTAAALNTDMTDLSRVLGQIYVKPKASMEEMLQLVERGVPVWDILQKKLGLTAEQMGNLGREGIEGKKVFEALMAGMNERYGGAMDRMSKSWAGLWSTFQDNINIALGKVAAPLIENFKVKLNAILEQLDKWTKDGTLDRWAKQAVDFITGVVDAISTIAKTLWALKDVIITVGEAWAIGFALTKISPFIKGLDNIQAYYRVLRADGGGVFSSLTGAAGESVPALKSLGGQLGGVSGLLKNLPAIGMAAFAGWQIGRLIGEITGLDNVLQDFWEKQFYGAKASVEQYSKFSESMAGVTDHAKDLRGLREEITQVGLNIDVTSNKFSVIAKAVYENKNAYNSLSDAAKLLVKNQAEATQKVIDGINATKKAKDDWAFFQSAISASVKAVLPVLQSETSEVSKLAEKLGFFTGSTADLDKQTRVLQAALKLVGDQFGTNKDAVNKVIKEVNDLKAAYLGMGKEVPPVLENLSLQAQQAKIRLSEIVIPELTDEEIEKGMAAIFKEGEEAAKKCFGTIEGGAAAVKTYAEAQNDANLKVYTFCDFLDDAAGFLGNLSGVLSQAANQLSELGILSESVGKFITDVGKGIGTIGTGIESFNKIGGSIFDKISGGLSILTGAISIAINLFKGLFETDWEGEATLMLSSFGGATDEMKEKLAALAKEMGNTQEAFYKLMGQFISEANITTREQFLTWLRGVYSLLTDAKNNNTAEAIENLNNAFEALAEKGDKLGFLGTEFQNLVARIKESGIELESLTTFINSQLEKATSGLNTYVAAGINSQQQFQTAVNLTLSLYNTLIENGVSRLDAFTRMKDIFQSLFDSALKSGYQMSSAFREIYDFQNKIAKNQALIDSITGLNDLLTGLANSGIKLSQKAFDDFTFSARDTYDQLVKAGFSGSEALSMIAPVLQNLQTMAGRYNLTIDETTQSLIDQATEQGLLSEKTKSDSQVIIGLLGAIAESLGATIPEELQNLVNAASGTFDAATMASKKWQNSVTAAGEEISEIPEIIGKFGNKNQEVTEEVVNQNNNVINTLTKIGDHYYMNSVALEVLGQKYQGFQSVLEGTELIVDKLAGGFETALFNMGGNTDALAGLIDDLATKLGVTIPDTLDTLEDKYKYVMAAMAKQTENYFTGPDGVLRSLLDTLAYIGQQTNQEIGGNYGVYTEAQKQEQTVKFFQMGHLWESNKNTILSSEANMKRFLDDLQNLHVTDAAKSQYDKFLASMNQWYSHFTKGETWDGSKWVKGEGGGDPNLGIYTEAQKQAMTTRFNEMARLWQDRKDDILARETNLRGFISELDGLVVISSAKSKYDNLSNAVHAAAAHFEKGETWDPVNDKWIVPAKAARGASFIVPEGFDDDTFPIYAKTGEFVNISTVEQTREIMKLLSRMQDYPAYLPDYQGQRQSDEQDDEQDNEKRLPFNPFQVASNRRTTIYDDFADTGRPVQPSQEPQKIQLQQTGPTYIINNYFPRGTSAKDKDVIVECVREAVRSNEGGFTGFLVEKIEEYDA